MVKRVAMKLLTALLAMSMFLSAGAALAGGAKPPKGASQTMKAFYEACKTGDMSAAQAFVSPELREEFTRAEMCKAFVEDLHMVENHWFQKYNRGNGAFQAMLRGESCLIGRGWYWGIACDETLRREFELQCEGNKCLVTKIGERQTFEY